MKTATGNSVLRAYSKAVKRLETRDIVSASVSAGFIIPDGATLGIQVFVKVCKFDELLLKKKPLTGGLLCNS